MIFGWIFIALCVLVGIAVAWAIWMLVMDYLEFIREVKDGRQRHKA